MRLILIAISESLQDFLQQHKLLVEDFLVRLLPQQTSHSLFAAMHYSVINGGKRIRPALVYATGTILDAPLEKLHAAAAAVELIHCYSLVHDDLPAMDDDDLRRGLPSCHKAFGEATAILTGDALQTIAFEILSNPNLNPVSPSQQIAMVNVLAKAAGSAGMILGQADDMEAEKKLLALDQLALLHKRKTGCLFNACLELGMIASSQEHNPEVREALLDYGHNLGLVFQIQDDILDVISDTETLGKPVGSDLESEKSTFTSLLGLDGAYQHVKVALNAAHEALIPLGPESKILGDIVNYAANRIK